MTSMNLRRLASIAPPLLLVVAAMVAQAGEAARSRVPAQKAAARVDALLEAALAEHKLKANPACDDETFARRTYLAVLGRIPTTAELASFVEAKGADKGLALVDDLLGARGHESHLFNWWADLLRVKSRLPQQISGEPYAHWLKESLAANKPYDEMVRELLAAEGPVHQRDNGATGYLMRDRNMPEDNMSNTIRLFLGSRVECAQCHNHPFDSWKQKQYFEMVAFTGGIQYERRPREDPRAIPLMRAAQERWGQNGVRALFRTLQPSFTGIYGSGTGAVQLPADYQYDDAKPRSWVTAHAMFAPSLALDVNSPGPERERPRARRNPQRQRRNGPQAAEIDSRETFAAWVTAPENERFSTVIANRVWKRLFGRGLIEPVDDLKEDTLSTAPELLTHLAALVRELDYDLREFERTLLYTRHWHREACLPAEVPGDAADLRGPLMRRMTAEQAWDSLLTLVVPDLDSTLAPPKSPRAELVYREHETLAGATDEQILERTGLMVLRYTDPAAARREQQRLREERRNEMIREMASAGPEERQRLRAGRALRDLQRASDLPSPAPPGHLLLEFGQSERDLIDASHADATVPQVLALLNDFLEQRLLNNRSAVLAKELEATRDVRGKVRTAFLAVLGRAPTAPETALWEPDIGRSGARALQDLVWTLVNSHEFLFVR